jgi:hypothetical protein
MDPEGITEHPSCPHCQAPLGAKDLETGRCAGCGGAVSRAFLARARRKVGLGGLFFKERPRRPVRVPTGEVPGAAARRLVHQWRRVMWGFLSVGLALLVGGALLAWALSFWNGTASFFALAVGFVGFPFTLTGGLVHPFVVRQADRDLAAFQRGDYLAHWTYTADEWRRLVRAEVAAEKRTWWVVPLLFGVFGGVGGFLLWPNEILGRLLAMVPAAVVLGAVGWVLIWQVRRKTRRFLRVVQETPPDVYVGPRGLYFNGRYLFFSMTYRVRFISGRPAYLALKSYRWMWSHSMSQSGFVDLRVPVPEGREEEAKALVSRLQWRW